MITATSQYLGKYLGKYLSNYPNNYLDVEMVDIKVNGRPAARGRAIGQDCGGPPGSEITGMIIDWPRNSGVSLTRCSIAAADIV